MHLTDSLQHFCVHSGHTCLRLCPLNDAEEEGPVLPVSADDDDDGNIRRKKRSKNNRNEEEKAQRKSGKTRERMSKTAEAAVAATAAGFERPLKNKERTGVHCQNRPSPSSFSASSATAAYSAASVGAGNNHSTKRLALARASPAPAPDSFGRKAGNSSGGGDIDTGEAAKAARAKAMVPMRPEEYADQQRTVREVRGRGHRGYI